MPQPVAHTIASDAVAYAKQPDKHPRQRMYRYQPPDGQPPEGEEAQKQVALPLDFEEVVAIAITAHSQPERDPRRTDLNASV